MFSSLFEKAWKMLHPLLRSLLFLIGVDGQMPLEKSEKTFSVFGGNPTNP